MNRDLNDELHDHDRGLAFDLSTLLSRRGALRMLAGAGIATLAGCATGSGGSSATSATSGAASSTSTGSDAAACEEIPEETAGPYPGDGSNGPNVLTQSGIVRSDIRSSFGKVTFRSIFPAAYSGRWPHVHFEVYPSLTAATSASSPTATSQLAFPEDACKLVYATDGYSQSVRNLAQTSLESDNVFGDGSSQQLATVTGNVTSGFTADLTVPV